ncbi:MAG: hypothetical protein AB1634_04865 [Thermodesulfobacteriota bacterium]
MSRKKVTRTEKRRPPAGQSLPPGEELREALSRHQAAGRLREAIDCCKQLLQAAAPGISRDTLAELYLSRSEQLAHKGLYREAAALWETRREQCGREDGQERLIVWLLQAGQPQRAIKAYLRQDNGYLGSPAGRAVTGFLAVQVLAGNGAVVRELPAGHLLLQHLPPARAALAAYCAGDQAALAASLAAIPFRSPYRDLRQLLSGLQRLEEDRSAGVQALAGLASPSAFGRLAQLVAAQEQPVAARLAGLAAIPGEAQEVVAGLWGLPPATWPCLQGLIRLQGLPPSPRELLKLVLSHGEVLGPDLGRRLLRRILAHDPAGLAMVRKQQGGLDPLLELRVQALALELDRHAAPDALEEAWQEVLAAVTEEADHSWQPLAAAMILRHLADHADTDPVGGRERAFDYRVESLAFDPLDKKTYQTVIANCVAANDLREANRWLERAIRHLPEDGEIRLAAAGLALRRGACRKAAGYAADALARDPLNQEARGVLINSLLAQAVKQAAAGKPQLAAKGLAHALREARTDAFHGTVILTQGLLELVQGHDQEAWDLMARGYQLRGGGMAADLRTLVTGRDMGVTRPRLIKMHRRLLASFGRPWDRQTVLDALPLIRLYETLAAPHLAWGMAQLEERLTAAAELPFSPEEQQQLCQTLAACQCFRALAALVDRARQSQPEAPILVYFESLCRYRGNSKRFRKEAGMREIDRLLEARADAISASDWPCAELITQWLGQLDYQMHQLEMLLEMDDDDENDFFPDLLPLPPPERKKPRGQAPKPPRLFDDDECPF